MSSPLVKLFCYCCIWEVCVKHQHVRAIREGYKERFRKAHHLTFVEKAVLFLVARFIAASRKASQLLHHHHQLPACIHCSTNASRVAPAVFIL